LSPAIRYDDGWSSGSTADCLRRHLLTAARSRVRCS
jgi:hypothetical protein